MLDKSWTTSEVAILRELYPASPKKEIMSGLSRSWFAIQDRANNLGIKRPYCDRNWSKDEIEKLGELYPCAPKDIIKDALPNRNWGNMTCKASSLGIERPMLNTSLKLVADITLSNTEASYIAGIVDGEGSIGIMHKIHSHTLAEYSPFITISNKDIELITWLKDKLPGQAYWHSSCCNFMVTRLTNVELILRLIMPFLIVKRKRADVVLRFCQQRITYGKLRSYSKEELALVAEAWETPTRNLDPVRTVTDVLASVGV